VSSLVEKVEWSKAGGGELPPHAEADKGGVLRFDAFKVELIFISLYFGPLALGLNEASFLLGGISQYSWGYLKVFEVSSSFWGIS